MLPHVVTISYYDLLCMSLSLYIYIHTYIYIYTYIHIRTHVLNVCIYMFNHAGPYCGDIPKFHSWTFWPLYCAQFSPGRWEQQDHGAQWMAAYKEWQGQRFGWVRYDIPGQRRIQKLWWYTHIQPVCWFISRLVFKRCLPDIISHCCILLGYVWL